MPFYRYFTKNNAQGVVLNDTSSQITFQAGHTLPTNVSSGDYLLTLGGPGGEIVKVTSASQDGSGVLTVDVTRSQEDSSYLDATSGTIGYLYLTAGMFNNTYDILEEHDIKLLKIDITGSVDLDQIEADTTTNNAKISNYNHTGDVTGSTVLGIVPTAISGKTTVTPVSGDYILIWDATDSALKKVDASNFLNLVSSVNGLTGAVTLVTGNISDTTSTQKYATAAQLSKIDYISVTQAVDLDTMESNIATNNAKITNATHTGDVTGADVLGIVPAAISGRTSVTAVSGDYVLIWDATDSALKKANVSDFIGGGAVDSVNGFTGVVTLVTGNISDTTSTQKYATAAQLAKVDYISVTQAVDLDTMESNIASNNAKVTNADHTGDVTGSLGLVIVPSAISGKTGVTPVSGDYVLLWDATDSALKKADVSNFLGGAVSSVNGFTGAVTLVTGNISDTTSTQKYATAAQLAKIDYISVTQAVDLDTMESNIATNNAKITNATHTGDVTGADVLGIVPAAISGKTGVTPVAGDYVLLWDATDSLLKKADVTTFISAGGGGDVTGPASSTNTGIAIFNGTGGKTLMNSLVTIDTSSVTIPGFLTVNGQARNPNQTALTTSGIVTWNIKNDPKAKIILAGDVTSLTFSGIELNGEATLYIKQDATVAYDITWPLTVTWAGGVSPDISELDSFHIVSFYSYDGTGLIGAHIGSSIISSGSVASVNGLTGTVTLVTGNISDTTSTQKYATAAQLAKVDYLTITQAVDLDTLESNVSTNNAKITNATHTGDVTGADVLGIVPAAISGKTSVTAVAGDYVLLWDATDSALKKADVSDFIGGGAVDSVNGFTGVVTLVTGNISDTTSTQKYTTAADITKMSYISVTQAVDLDTMESNIATNNAKVTNANHTGDVTGSDVLGIVPAAISGKTGVTPVAGDYVLLWDATDSLLKKADVSTFVNGSYGDVTGPASSTNTGIAIFNGTGGKTLMDSLVTIDTSSVTVPGFLTITGQVRNSAQTALSTSAIVTWNINNDPKASIAMTNDITSFTISGININSNAILYVKQHASAAKTITWPATIKWSGNTTPDISNLNSINVFSFYSYDGTGLIGTHVTDQTSSFTPNANHTGDVTGANVLGIVPAAISGRSTVTAVAGDYVLLWDATDSTLKKADVTDFISAVTASSTTTFTNKRITRRVTTLTDAATIAINSDNMDMGKVTLTASRTLGTPTGTPTDGQPLLIEVVQGGTGSYTLTADSTSTAGSYRFGSDVTGFTLSTAVGKKDLILLTYLSDITGWAVTAISKGYPA